MGVVGRRDDRAAGGSVGGDETDDGRPRAPVLPDRRFVREQHCRTVEDGCRDRQPPLLPAGQVARVGALEVAEAEGGQEGAGTLGVGSVAAPRAREVASTSSSTVPATIVELDHCGTHAIARARSRAVEVRRCGARGWVGHCCRVPPVERSASGADTAPARTP